ncbi:SpoIID/LytB domain-containing protein [Anaerocolumna sedimenticola]|uniref:SpoIID/LytB domain-containing protein n=1 Tax=Anaerocolumna sedimenticola TaxID=2696063 RepID=A0A6P1TN94_9FIRM|nr:SpoIID/LytB domain-containing protein [Anaerocolumna sedimenticola]QHQ61155.1 SpoIID/LytB domain-containing protein [Anaerocolumna sedimenticola]
MLKEGRIRIETKSENGKIKLLSIKRSGNNPAYRGAMELSSAENGIIVINELPIEDYLYAVIPSEMPSDYGEEALKVQAICARSYAYNQLFANGYSQYGAHVDDSVSYQVYNNIPENEATILAVKDTYGKVIRYNDAVITAYYFSTSCGRTASLNEVWGSSQSVDYLLGKMQTTYDVVNGEAVYASSGSPEGVNFSTEKAFRNFIMNPPKDTYDSKFPWYRWDVTITKADLKKSIDKTLANRYNANPDLIQTLVGGNVNDNPKYESKPVSTIGTVKDVLVSKREKSGILSAIVLVGSDRTVKVQSEYNIRTLLAPITDEVVRLDKSKAPDLGMLPSAFFVMDKSEKSITFHGGGYGHGVGMSQNGVKAMADSGKNYEEIIKHYYTGVDIGFIY